MAISISASPAYFPQGVGDDDCLTAGDLTLLRSALPPELLSQIFLFHLPSLDCRLQAQLHWEIECAGRAGSLAYSGQDAMVKAAENGEREHILLAISQRHSRLPLDHTYLHIMADRGFARVAQYLLATHKVDINAVDNIGRSPLIRSCIKGNSNIAQLLLTNNANPNLCDGFGRSALIYAAFHGFYDIVKLCLDNGGDIEQKDIGQRTALIWSCLYGHWETANLLLSSGADPLARDLSGSTCLIISAKHHRSRIAQVLLSNGADINAVDKFGRTALMWSCIAGDEKMVAVLFRSDPALNIRCRQGLTALDYAHRCKREDIATSITMRLPLSQRLIRAL